MSEGRALATAPLAIFPVALLFVSVQAFLAGDMREMLVSPVSAAMITIVGYPFAIVAAGLAWRALSKFAAPTLPALLLAGFASAEALFWGLISPFWQRTVSDGFCFALLGACGLACGAALFYLLRRPGAQ